jgi:hypothetical protein
MQFVAIGCILLIACIMGAPTLHMNHGGGLAYCDVRILVCDGLFAINRRDWLLLESDFGMTVATLLLTVLLLDCRMDRRDLVRNLLCQSAPLCASPPPTEEPRRKT